MLDNGKGTAQNRQAAETFWSSIRPVSTLSASHYKLGRYYQQQRKYEKAIGEFAKALRNDGSYCQAYNGIAMSYDGLKRCEMASTSYEQAITCDPQQAYLYNNYACSSILCGDYEKGLALLSKAGQLSEDNIRIKNNMKLAQMLVEGKNTLAQSPPQKPTVAIAARPDLPPAAMEDEGSQTDPPAERPFNAPPEEALHGDVVEKIVVENVEQNSAGPEVDLNGLAELISDTGKENEMWTVPTADAAIVSRETGKTVEAVVEAPESAVPDNIVINNLVIAMVQEPDEPQGQAGPALDCITSTVIEVSNGNGVNGMAGRSADYLRSYGFTVGRITNAKDFSFNDSVIFYREGYLQVAEELARLTPGLQDLKKVDFLGRPAIGVRILLGRDLVKMQFPDGYARNITPGAVETDQKADPVSPTRNMADLAVTY
jgi:tetratricopeptide (TPR) repeat protein